MLRRDPIFKCLTLAAAATASHAGALPVQWPVGEGGNGHYYEFVEDYFDWFGARDAAQSRSYESVSGYLATITSQQEQDFLLAAFGGAGNPPIGWLGGYQDTSAGDYAEPAGGWRWITGEAWGYTNWAPNQPDQFIGIPQNHLRAQTGLQWDDIDFATSPAFIQGYYVEYPLPAIVPGDANGDGYVDTQDIQALVSNWDPGATDHTAAEGDFNGDGRTDTQDIQILVSFWSPQPGAPAPEPASMVLLSVSAMLATRRRR